MQTTEMMAIRTADGGTMNCYVAKADREPGPAVIVIQEIFGITDWLKSTADWLASAGFTAVVPDLFWRMEPGLNLNDRDPEQMQKAFKLFGEFDQAKGVSDLKDVVAHLRDHRSINGKIGCIGYCLGGLLAYYMACRSDVQASVSYYGVSIDEHLDEAKNIKAPLLMHIAGGDTYVTPDKQQKIKNALDSNPNVSIHIYPELGHAFGRVGGEHYNKEAADLANSRTEQFLKNNLK